MTASDGRDKTAKRARRRGRKPRRPIVEAVPAPGLHPEAVQRFHRALTDLRVALALESIEKGIAYIDEQGNLNVTEASDEQRDERLA